MLKQVYDYCIANNGGTFDICESNHNPKTGYMVSEDGSEKIIFSGFSPSVIADYIAENMRKFSVYGGYFGVWRNPETGHWHLDVSYNFDDKAEAETFARKNNQLAYWDCANAVAINI